MNSGRRSSRTKLHGAVSIIVFLASGFGVAAADIVVFSIVDRVQFSVPGDWVVIASKSGAKRTTFAFQIKNPADEGTTDSTNLAVNSYYLKDHDAKDAFDKRKSSQDPKRTLRNSRIIGNAAHSLRYRTRRPMKIGTASARSMSVVFSFGWRGRIFRKIRPTTMTK
jgi:hypothetical protein